jgi:hypothetical protein
MLSQRAEEAAAFARAALTDAQDFTNAHASILAKHRTHHLSHLSALLIQTKPIVN